MSKTVGAQTMSSDDHMMTWALETGQRFDEVDDENANYHAECGYHHTPGWSNCPMSHWSDE